MPWDLAAADVAPNIGAVAVTHVKKRLLTVGVSIPNNLSEKVNIENLGLCSPQVRQDVAASPLYEYDAIIINPESFSHFIFGKEGPFSRTQFELSNLKRSNLQYNYRDLFDFEDRAQEMKVALSRGCFVVWCLAPSRRQGFPDRCETSQAYLNRVPALVVKHGRLIFKNSNSIDVLENSEIFLSYFEQLRVDGWQIALSVSSPAYKSIAETPEGYSLGGRVDLGKASGWLLTPPTSDASRRQLVHDVLKAVSGERTTRYRSIFLCHATVDKTFVNRLKTDLLAQGVNHVWVDEAEILIGDSLLRKIEEGIKISRFVGVVLSPRSVDKPWVRRELEIAMNLEINSGKVVVLPILYEKCDIPLCLQTKLYADFTEENHYKGSLEKLLRRVKSG